MYLSRCDISGLHKFGDCLSDTTRFVYELFWDPVTLTVDILKCYVFL